MTNTYAAFTRGGGIPTYATAAALPASAADGAAAITLDTDTLYIFNLGTVTWVAPPSTPGNLAGDVTSVGLSTTVALVGGSTAANVHTSQLATAAATDANTASTIVKRDGSGNFSATTITANLTGNASGTAASITGNLTGDVTSVGMATTLAKAPLGVTVTSATAGSLLYAGTALALSQDNANLFYDASNKRLGLGGASPSYQISVNGGAADVATGKAVIEIINNAPNYGPQLRLNAGQGRTYAVISTGPNDSGGANQFVVYDGSGGGNRLTISSAGHVAVTGTNFGVNGVDYAFPAADGSAGQYLKTDGSKNLAWISPTGGTVTTLSVVSANGFAGTVATATTTPAITLTTSITGLLKGNATAISAATVGTDYSSGTSGLATGILKSTTTTGALTIAVAGDFPTLNQNTSGSAASLSAVLAPASGGTGVANNASSTLTISGAFATTLTVSATTSVTLPTSGTLWSSGGNNTTSGTNTVTNTTNATTASTGAILCSGGISAVKNIVAGGQIGAIAFATASSSTALTIDWNNSSVQTTSMTGNCTFTLTNPIAGMSYLLVLTQDGTGSRTLVATSPVVKWKGGVQPTLTTTATTGRDIISLFYDGTVYWGSAGNNFA